VVIAATLENSRGSTRSRSDQCDRIFPIANYGRCNFAKYYDGQKGSLIYIAGEIISAIKHALQSGKDLCKNPVTGAGFVYGVDPTGRQKKAAYSALLARDWFAFNGPADAQPLPLWCDERKAPGLLAYIARLYARSLADRNYDVREHPPFADYISGVLWEAERVDGIIGTLPIYPTELPKLTKRFPPRELTGMGPGFCWLHLKCTPKRCLPTGAERLVRPRSLRKCGEPYRSIPSKRALPQSMKARELRRLCAAPRLSLKAFTGHPRIRL
jgi:hypothetical protein